MSIATRIETIEEHIENAYQHLIDLGVDLTNIPKNIDNISAMLKTVYNDYSKVTGTGTEVTLANARKGKMVIEPKGNTLQNSYSGKNLLNAPIPYNTNVSGTTNKIFYNIPKLELNKTYFVYGECSDGTVLESSNSSFVLRNNQSGQLKNVGFNRSFTNDVDMSNVDDVLIYTNSTFAGKTISKIMVSEGSTATDYEPYVGGIPAPNPSYPQIIRNVREDNNVVIGGKNLFDIDKVNEPSTGVTVVKTNTSVKGTFLTAYTSAGSIFLNLKNKVYSFKGEITNTGNGARFEIRYYKNETQVGNTETTYDFKSIDNTSNIYDTVKITLSNGTDIGEITFKEMQLVEGTYTSSTMPNYEPYITPIEKPLNLSGKNLLEPNSFAQKVIDSPYRPTNPSSYDSETGALNINMGDGSVVFSDFEVNSRYTIIFKYNVTSRTELNLRILYTDNTNDDLNIPSTGEGILVKTTAVGKTVKSIIHSASNSVGSRILYLKESGIFEGIITVSDFEPYYNYTLMKDDYITEDCVIHHKRNKVDASNLTWTQYATNKYKSEAINNLKLPIDAETVPNLFAEKYIPVKYSKTFTNGDIGIENHTSEFAIFDNTGTPTGIIEYELNTETTETIPNTIPLYNQVKDLYRTIIPGGTVVIETESDEENAQLIVSASALR